MTQHHIPQDLNCHSHHCKKLKSCKITVIWNVTPHSLAERHQYFGGIAISIFRQITTKIEPAGSYNTLPPTLHLPDYTALDTLNSKVFQ